MSFLAVFRSFTNGNGNAMLQFFPVTSNNIRHGEELNWGDWNTSLTMPQLYNGHCHFSAATACVTSYFCSSQEFYRVTWGFISS